MNLFTLGIVLFLAGASFADENRVLRPRRQFFQTFVDSDDTPPVTGVQCSTNGCTREVKNEKGEVERVNVTVSNPLDLTQNGQPCPCREKRQFFEVHLKSTKSGKWDCTGSFCKCICETVATTDNSTTTAATTAATITTTTPTTTTVAGSAQRLSRRKRQFIQSFQKGVILTNRICDDTGCYEAPSDKTSTTTVAPDQADNTKQAQGEDSSKDQSKREKRQVNQGDACSCRQEKQFNQFIQTAPTSSNPSGVWTCVGTDPCYCSCPQAAPVQEINTANLNAGSSCECRQKRQFNQFIQTAPTTNPSGVWTCAGAEPCYCSCPSASTGFDFNQFQNPPFNTGFSTTNTGSGSGFTHVNIGRKRRFIRGKRSPQFHQTFKTGAIAHNYDCKVPGSCSVSVPTTTTTTTTTTTSTTTSTTTTPTTTTTIPIYYKPVTTQAAYHVPSPTYNRAPAPVNPTYKTNTVITYHTAPVSSQTHVPAVSTSTSGGSFTYTQQNGKSWNTGVRQSARVKREVASMFNQAFETGATAENFNCLIAGSCATGSAPALPQTQNAPAEPNAQASTSKQQSYVEPQLYQNFLFGAENCKQFGNCTTVPTVVTTGAGTAEEKDDSKFYQTYSENSIIQNFDCRNGGCGDLGERLQKMFESLKKSSLKNQQYSVPVIYG